jgi:Uncharacterized protein conserved in bacteria (DUF2059)
VRAHLRWGAAAAVLSSALALMGEAAGPGDTTEDRRAAADEFLAVVPVGEEVDALIREISHDVSSDRQDWFVEQMSRQVDLAYVRRVMMEGLIGNLTAAELKAAARFYATPEGHAVRDKLPKAIDDVMPLIQEELARTVRRLPP